jgi:REP element-mobilizing transposase RayT
MTKLTLLEHGKYYHIYNRGNNRENIFIEERNYRYFLQLYTRYIEPVADTYAYCLMRNHFHVLARIKDDLDPKGFQNPLDLPRLDAGQQFGKLFNAYAKAINKAYQRTGSLFQNPFRRKEVNSDAYFRQLVVYIHRNPQKHGFVKDFRDWPYSSYQALLSDRPTHVKRVEVVEWFGDAPTLAEFHLCEVDEREVAPVLLEEDW